MHPLFRPFLLASLALLVPACGTKDSGEPVVGVTLLDQQDFFYRELEAGMRDAAAKAHLHLLVQSAEKDLAQQTAQVENFVVRGAKAIIACPVDSRGIAQALRRAQDAGVGVFTADIAAEGLDVTCHVASDNVQGGRLAGAFLAKQLADAGAVAIVDHPQVASVQDRVRGFTEEIAKHPGIEIVARPSAEGKREMALDVATNTLQAHPQIKGIFAINDETAMGVLRALDGLGKEDVVVVGYDATPEARDAIRKGGALQADVVQHPREIGRQVVEAVAAWLKGEKVPSVEPVDVSLLTRESLEKEDAASGAH